MLSQRLIKIAVCYFTLGVSMGIYMGISHDFRLTHVHAHINLLGWVALGLVGVIYRVYPALEAGMLGRLHFWLHNVGLPMFMGGFTLRVLGGGDAATVAEFSIAAGASCVALAVLGLCVNVLRNITRVVSP